MSTDQHESEQRMSGTGVILQELALYAYRPFSDEPDPRPLPEDRMVAGAVADMFDGMVAALQDTRIEPDLEDGIRNDFERGPLAIRRRIGRRRSLGGAVEQLIREHIL